MTDYTLQLSFDLRQVTQSLAFHFALDDKTHYPQLNEGPLAGTFNFQKGDNVFVEITASSAASISGSGAGPKDILKDFSVTDCTFVSVPAKMTERLSPFDKNSARSSVQDWGPVSPVQDASSDNENVRRLRTRSVNPLSVVTKNGQWQTSGYLSVVLTASDGTTHAQLYFFDPESSTGNGGGVN